MARRPATFRQADLLRALKAALQAGAAGPGQDRGSNTEEAPAVSVAAPVSVVYGARTIKRVRRTKAAISTLDQQILDVLEEDHPQSVRHVFYRMTNPRLDEPVEKSDRGYRHVQYRVLELRRSGRLPYGWISDATRRGYHTHVYASGADFLRRVNGLYRADLWTNTAYHVEVWVESRSIAGVVEDDCEELAVSLYPAGGFSSATLTYEAVEEVTRRYSNAEWMIFYIGDYDPAGVLIDKAIERELRKHLDAHHKECPNDNFNLTFKRIGISEDQIQLYDLPTKPRKETDRRSRHVTATVEAEAMPARVLRQILREEIEALLPDGALAAAKVAEHEERKAINLAALAMEERAA